MARTFLSSLSLYPRFHFNQLHAGCGQRIRYEKHCPVHGKVEAGAIVSGYAYAPDQYVVIDQAELEPLRPAKERALSLERFVDPQELDPPPRKEEPRMEHGSNTDKTRRIGKIV